MAIALPWNAPVALEGVAPKDLIVRMSMLHQRTSSLWMSSTSAASSGSVIDRPVSIATRAPARSASNSSLSASSKAVRAGSVVADAESVSGREADDCGGVEFMR
jgi:hypothetical protein